MQMIQLVEWNSLRTWPWRRWFLNKRPMSDLDSPGMIGMAVAEACSLKVESS